MGLLRMRNNLSGIYGKLTAATRRGHRGNKVLVPFATEFRDNDGLVLGHPTRARSLSEPPHPVRLGPARLPREKPQFEHGTSQKSREWWVSVTIGEASCGQNWPAQ